MSVDVDEQLADAACQAAIGFMADVPERINKIIRQHRRGPEGFCTAHTEVWPCFVLRLAHEAKRRLATIPSQRRATP